MDNIDIINLACSGYKPKFKSLNDFEEDLNHLRRIKKAIKKYKKDQSTNLRLMINYFILWFNSFDESVGVKLIIENTDEEYYDIIYSIFKYLHININDNEYNQELYIKLKEL